MPTRVWTYVDCSPPVEAVDVLAAALRWSTPPGEPADRQLQRDGGPNVKCPTRDGRYATPPAPVGLYRGSRRVHAGGLARADLHAGGDTFDDSIDREYLVRVDHRRDG